MKKCLADFAVVHFFSGHIKCCTSLEIAVSAVGVERAEEWMWLESAGISQFQGNLFASARLGGLPAGG